MMSRGGASVHRATSAPERVGTERAEENGLPDGMSAASATVLVPEMNEAVI